MKKMIDIDNTVFEYEKIINNKTIEENKIDFKKLNKILNKIDFKKQTDLYLLNLMFYYTTLKYILNIKCNQNKNIPTSQKITDIFNELTSRNYEFISILNNIKNL